MGKEVKTDISINTTDNAEFSPKKKLDLPPLLPPDQVSTINNKIREISAACKRLPFGRETVDFSVMPWHGAMPEDPLAATRYRMSPNTNESQSVILSLNCTVTNASGAKEVLNVVFDIMRLVMTGKIRVVFPLPNGNAERFEITETEFFAFLEFASKESTEFSSNLTSQMLVKYFKRDTQQLASS